MPLIVLGLTIKTLGEVIIGLSVVSVHMRIMEEHKLDKRVYRSIRNEKFWGTIGVILIITGFSLEVFSYLGDGVI
jgi:hypothetical protein